ncbi:MAG: universal stress protein [Cyanobacteria bacterium P01_A01_bin.135]
MKRILVALDYDDTCAGVLEQAIDLAQATQATLNLLSVLAPQTDESFSFSSPYADQDWAASLGKYREAGTASLTLLKGFADKAKAAGIETEVTQDMGNPGSVICKLAKRWDADLIMVGSHGRRGLSEMLLGSVSNYVVHHAPCSVLIVHGQS